MVDWVDIEKRKPPCNGNYLVTIECCDEIYTDIAYYYKKSPCGNTDIFSVDVSEEYVIAWAELPEPYQKVKVI